MGIQIQNSRYHPPSYPSPKFILEFKNKTENTISVKL